MDEKIIIKSERFNVKKVAAIIVIIGFALLIAYAVFDTIKYSDNFNELAAKNYDWFDYFRYCIGWNWGIFQYRIWQKSL